jgi:hypothetical protein
MTDTCPSLVDKMKLSDHLYRLVALLALALAWSASATADTGFNHRYNDPWDQMAKWNASAHGGDSQCRAVADRLARTLSRTESCEEWGVPVGAAHAVCRCELDESPKYCVLLEV